MGGKGRIFFLASPRRPLTASLHPCLAMLFFVKTGTQVATAAFTGLPFTDSGSTCSSMSMSYRTIKRLLGETSLERKCRFLFGGGLMILITGSFYIYAQVNSGLVKDENELLARSQIEPALLMKHWQFSEREDLFEPFKAFALEIKPDELRDVQMFLYPADPQLAETDPRPDDTKGYTILEQFLDPKVENFIETVKDRETGRKYYHYYEPLRATKSCLGCHYHWKPGIKTGDLIGMAKIRFPLKSTENKLAYSNAILLATAIVTASLAMLAVYAMVRYVIVKPVLHLKDVSDQIAHGNLDLRADIRTGDEFEELSHAFNRMLRHLVTVQDELRGVNTDLDAKVDELAQVNLRLYEMNKLKDEFLTTMSHELRTPLNSILGFSDVLAGAENLNEKQLRYLANIQTSGRELMVMINDILDLAKIESGKMALQLSEVSVFDLIERQVDVLLPLAKSKNINLTSSVDSRLSTLRQDAGKLQQILNNLLSNAIKFTPEGGRVRVRVVSEDDKTIQLVVEDTGIGIPLEEQETIFEKFRQGKVIPGQGDTLTREYGGTGLGLSIVKELSKLLGGEVLLESEFGKGSTFTVRLPIRFSSRTPLIDDRFAQTVDGLGGSKLPIHHPPSVKSQPTDAASELVESQNAVTADQSGADDPAV